jgi:DNA-binding LacI/PurR family transcriptional regulator
LPKLRHRPTSADVAAQAGVSRTTVSLVLNDRGTSIPDATRKRVLDAARELGYHPHHSAQGLAAGRTYTLALVLRQSAAEVAGDALLAETLRGLTGAARSAHYRVLVEPLTPGDASYGDLVRSRRADGAVVSGPLFDDPELAELVADGFPIVIQGNLPGSNAPSVDIDNVATARVAVEHLISLGHRVIACITNAPLTYVAAADRVAGYEAALRGAGIELSPDLVEQAAFDAASGHRAMRAVLARCTPEAVFVASDVVALGVIGALRQAGLSVPGDVSVIGFDDIPLAAYFDPPLTTMRVPANDLGLAAGTALLDLIAGREVPLRTLLATRIVIRSSTAPRAA